MDCNDFLSGVCFVYDVLSLSNFDVIEGQITEILKLE